MTGKEVQEILKRRFELNGFTDVTIEAHAGAKRRVDIICSYGDCTFAFEIKTGVADLLTGYGLNQERCGADFGYIVCVDADQNFIERTVGHLYFLRMIKTGVYTFNSKTGEMKEIKPAQRQRNKKTYEKKQSRINLALQPYLAEAIRTKAWEQRQSVNSYIESILEEYVL